MSDSGIRVPIVKVNPEQELIKAENRLNGLLAGLSEVSLLLRYKDKIRAQRNSVEKINL